MSWDKIFGEEVPEETGNNSFEEQPQNKQTNRGVFGAPPPGNEKFFQGQRPQRYEDLPTREQPQAPDLHAGEPWYVGPEPKERTFEPKKVVTRTVSILFPILGLTVMISIIAGITFMVVKIYG